MKKDQRVTVKRFIWISASSLGVHKANNFVGHNVSRHKNGGLSGCFLVCLPQDRWPMAEEEVGVITGGGTIPESDCINV